jgi:hypothetical protein
MSREIEADFRMEWENEETQCRKCVSFSEEGGETFCSEGKCAVPPDAHCDFFQSID